MSVLLLLGVLLVRGREERVALCLSFLPTTICDSCVWLVTGYGYMIHSDLSFLILCQILYSRGLFFYAIFGGIFGALFLGFSWGGFGGVSLRDL